MMTATHPYHHTPACLDTYRRRARWRRRLARARRMGGWVLRQAVALFWVGALWAAAVTVLCVMVTWGMG